MEILTMESVISKGKYANKSVAELLNIKGQIFSMIKEGYVFDDEVLKDAHITKIIRDEKVYCSVGKSENIDYISLPTETASMKQILSEINVLDSIGDKMNEDENTNVYTNGYENDYDEPINIENFDE